MQSFATVLLAGCIACLAMMMMNPDAGDRDQLYALEITLEENGQRFSAEQVLVQPGQSYTVSLDAGADYNFSIEVPGNTREVQDPFGSDMAERTGEYLELQTALKITEPDIAESQPDYIQLIAANLLLSMAEPAREVRSIIPVTDLGLLTQAGIPVESLAITIKGTPYRG
nr:hypothetical protein [Hyphomonas sp. Mor2]